MTPARTRGGVRRRNDPLLVGIAGVLLLCSLGALAFVARTLRDGFLDARPKHARDMDPIYVHAAGEPFGFYALLAGLAALAILLLVIAVRMLRQGLGR